jgi:esterase/lipase
VPFKNNMQVYYDRKWLAASSGTDIGDEKEFKKYFTENLWALDLFQEAMNNNLMVTLPKINCPVYFFVGHKDYQTNFSVSQAYYNELKAPKKQLFWFEKSAHLVPFTEPVLMQQIIIDQILPQAYK